MSVELLENSDKSIGLRQENAFQLAHGQPSPREPGKLRKTRPGLILAAVRHRRYPRIHFSLRSLFRCHSLFPCLSIVSLGSMFLFFAAERSQWSFDCDCYSVPFSSLQIVTLSIGQILYSIQKLFVLICIDFSMRSKAFLGFSTLFRIVHA